MPLTAFALLLCLMLAPQAQAAQPPPHIPRGVPYAVARARLIKAGFLPARIVEKGLDCGGKQSLRCTEQIYCAGDIDYCEWLFIRKADEAFFIVQTGSADRDGLASDRYGSIFRGKRSHLKDFDLVVLTPRGRRVVFGSPAPPPTPEDVNREPLCSEPHQGQPCWIKPPAGYRR
jgi:hypothetical protein